MMEEGSEECRFFKLNDFLFIGDENNVFWLELFKTNSRDF